MILKRINIAFLITTAVSVLVFIYLVILGYDDIKTVKDVIKIIASILFPIPMLFFVRFIVIERFMPKNTRQYIQKNKRPATILLIFTVIVCVTLMYGIELITKQKLEDHLIFAHLINSTAISSYVLNFILYNNLKANGILSGVLLSLAIHVFFVTA